MIQVILAVVDVVAVIPGVTAVTTNAERSLLSSINSSACCFACVLLQNMPSNFGCQEFNF